MPAKVQSEDEAIDWLGDVLEILDPNIALALPPEQPLEESFSQEYQNEQDLIDVS